jgi:hypothetical protein
MDAAHVSAILRTFGVVSYLSIHYIECKQETADMWISSVPVPLQTVLK